jgi:hypothetical protein
LLSGPRSLIRRTTLSSDLRFPSCNLIASYALFLLF